MQRQQFASDLCKFKTPWALCDRALTAVAKNEGRSPAEDDSLKKPCDDSREPAF